MANKLLRTLEQITRDINNKNKEPKKYDPAKQVEGIETRLEDAGVDVEKENDKRNFLEKAFNLPEDQNVLFDVFEILNRPQQAMFGAVKSQLEGDGVLEGLKDGISGNRDTQFKDILNDLGVTEETEGAFGVDDVLGFAGDVLLDPLDAAFLGAGGVAKAAKAADTAKDSLAAAQYGLEVAENAQKINDTVEAAQAVEQAMETVNTAQKLSDEATMAFNKLPKKNRSIKQFAMQGLGSGFKGMFSLADTGVEKTLEWFAKSDIQDALNSFDNLEEMNAAIKVSDELVKSGAELTKENLELIKEANSYKIMKDRKVKSLDIGLNTYRGIKDTIEKTFNIAKSLPKGLMDKVYSIRGKASLSEAALKAELGQTTKFIDEATIVVAEKMGMTVEDASAALNTIFERGNVLFTEDGKMTLKGMSKEVNFNTIITDKIHLENMGINKDTAEQLENIFSTYFKEWYDEVMESTVVRENGGSLWHITKGEGGLTDSYRIAQPALRDGDDSTGIVNKLKELDAMEDSDVIINEGKTPVPDREQKILARLDEHIEGVGTLRKNGRSIDPSKTSVVEERLGLERAFEDTVLTRNKAQAELERIDKIKYKPGKKAAAKSFLEAQQEAAIAEASLVKFVRENSESNRDILARLTKQRDEIIAKYPDIKLVTAGDLKKILSDKFELPHHMSNEMIANLEKIAQLEETQEIMAATAMFTSKAQKSLTEVQNSGISFTDGYLPHTLTDEWAEKKINDLMNPKTPAEKILRKEQANWLGDGKAMGDRTWQTSAYEANILSQGYVDYLKEMNPHFSKSIVGDLNHAKTIKMFAEDINTSLVEMVQKTTKGTADAQVFHEAILQSVFNPEGGVDEYSDYLRAITPGAPIPQGYTPVSADDLNRKMNDLGAYLNKKDETYKASQKIVDEFFKTYDGKEIYMNKNLERLLRISDRSQEPKHMLKFMDKLNNIFKSNKLLSPGFQLRNIVGNTSNMMLSGVPLKNAVGGMPKASKAIRNGEKLMQKVAEGKILTGKETEILNYYKEFAQHGFIEYGNSLHDIPEHLLNRNKERTNFGKKLAKNRKADSIAKSTGGVANKAGMTLQDVVDSPVYAMDKIKKMNMDMNQHGDVVARMSLWTYAKDNPQWLADSGFDSPEQAVRMILFEHGDLTVAEQDVMKKIIPFYTFTKKNLAFQIQNLGKNTTKYSQLMKSFDSMWGVMDLEPEERDMYKIENFWIPIPGVKEDGTYYAIKSSLPLGDLGEFLETPLQRAVSATAPVVRAPFEMVMNKQAFSGMNISNYKGEKGFYIPELSKRQEYALSQIGLDVPAMAGFDIGRTVSGIAKGETEGIGDVLNKGFGRTIMSEGNVNKTRERAAYNKLDNVQNSLRYYKERGFNIRTLAEINNKDKFNSTNRIIAQLKSMQR